jgi:hypothetical protein
MVMACAALNPETYVDKRVLSGVPAISRLRPVLALEWPGEPVRLRGQEHAVIDSATTEIVILVPYPSCLPMTSIVSESIQTHR